MEGPYAKQRRFPRVPAECPVLVRKLEGDKITRMACTKVMGLGGCMFRHDKPIGDGAVLSLLILVNRGYLEARGRIVYEIPREDQKYDIGVEFIDIAEEDLEALKSLFEKEES
jgi:hypothetical protein